MATKASTGNRTKQRRTMVRKQIYIYPQQDEQIKRLAQQRAISEAEVIREAIAGLLVRQHARPASKPLPPDEVAWQAILASIEEHRAKGLSGEPYRWKREDGYDDERYRRPWAQPIGETHDPA